MSAVVDLGVVLPLVPCLRSAIRCTSDPRLVRDSPDDLTELCVLERVESVASGVLADSVDVEGLRVTCRCVSTRGVDERTLALSDVASVVERVELSLRDGLTLLVDELGAGVESVEGRLDCTSRRRAAMRSTMD